MSQPRWQKRTQQGTACYRAVVSNAPRFAVLFFSPLPKPLHSALTSTPARPRPALVPSSRPVGYHLLLRLRLRILCPSGGPSASWDPWLHRFWSTGSVVVAQGLGCSVACGILLDQRLNSCLLHWQADSFPLSHHGSPRLTVIEDLSFIF